jgi:isoquinoline 1-oxidoreductase
MPDSGWEIERYELSEGPAYRFELDRRQLFGLLGGGLIVACTLEAFQESGARGRRGGEPAPAALGAWLHIGEDGRITVYSGKAEVGQNVRTMLTQVAAEELRCPVSSISLVLGDTDLTPHDAGTFGSRSTPAMVPQIRRAAAAAREMLIDLAAEHWKTGPESLVIGDGKIFNQAGQAVHFGQLTRGQKLMRTIAAAPVTAPAQWKIQGTAFAKVNGQEMVTGRHKYSPDVSRPGMLFGKVLRPTSYGAKLASADLSAAQSIAGVTAVRDGDFVGVTAGDPATAERALAAVGAEWKPAEQVSSRHLFAHLKETAGEGRGSRKGSIDDGMAAADHKLSEVYTVAYIAHAPLEPRAAVAEWSADKLTVWTGTQRPFGVRGELAQAFRIPESQVRVIVPDTGSGYGGKHTGEAALEAARLARAAGKPVKLVWTREEEFTWAYFRPAGVIEVTAGVRKDGTVTAWEFHNYNSGGSAIQTLYDVPNQRIEFHGSRSPLRQGSYRALAATANHFAREVAMDELAHAAGVEPLAFRLKNTKDERLRRVLEAATERFGWHRASYFSNGRGRGIAGGSEKGSYIATCVEWTGGRITRIVAAFECGAVINPDHLSNQIEGAIVMGLGGALSEAIEFENGRILNAAFSTYHVPRFHDVPEIETVLVDRKEIPSVGAGETPIVGLAPAISNAIFHATGERLRSMPMARNGKTRTA